MSVTLNRRVVLSAPAVLLASRAFAQQKTPFRFGALMPTTGPEAGYGLDFVKTYEMAVKDVNDKGGVAGRPLEMIVLDTQAKPEVAINAANRLIEVDKVPVIFTAWSSVVKAVAPIANRTSTLELNMGANSPDIAELGEYVYTVFPLAEVDVTALAKYSKEKLGKSKAAVVYINNESGIGGARIYRDVFTAAGGQVVAFEAYDPKTSDFTGVLLKARVGNPDVVHIHGLSELAQVVAQMRQLGMQQQITTYSVGYNPKILSQLGAAAEGLIVTSLAPTSSTNPNVSKLIDLWKQVGRAPNGLPYLQYAWDSTIVVAELFNWVEKNKLPHTGANHKKALLDIRTFDLPMTGKMVISDDHRVSKPVYLYVVKNKEFVLLDTIS